MQILRSSIGRRYSVRQCIPFLFLHGTNRPVIQVYCQSRILIFFLHGSQNNPTFLFLYAPQVKSRKLMSCITAGCQTAFGCFPAKILCQKSVFQRLICLIPVNGKTAVLLEETGSNAVDLFLIPAVCDHITVLPPAFPWQMYFQTR